MVWINYFLIVYGATAIALFIRYVEITNRERKIWKEQEIEIEIKKFIPMMIKDAVIWPWYILWYGIKQFVEELK